jgi:hypothetical protein
VHSLAELFTAEELAKIRKVTSPMVAIDTTGDGLKDSYAIDTTEDGRVDTFVDNKAPRVRLDTTGDGKVDHIGIDTTKDGKVDTLVPVITPGDNVTTPPSTPPHQPNPGGADVSSAADKNAAQWERMMWATRVLNRLLRKYSEASSLVMTNLPIPGAASMADPKMYMAQIDLLTADIPLILLVAGVNDLETITMHS